MNIIEVELLSKIFKSGKKAVDDLTFNVKQGEIFGFLGPNGAGKSTTIRMLTTLSKPTSGRATLVGYDLLRETAKIRQSIGYVAQEPGVDLNATGRENLVLQGNMFHLPRKIIYERVDELLKLVELKDDADRLVRTYSGGMKKRLDIATGLIHRPKLLFLDEPTTGLDPHTRSHLWEYIKKLNREEGITIFLTTHYLEEADKLSERVAIIDFGRIVAEGNPDTLKDEITGDTIKLQLEDKTEGNLNRASTLLGTQSIVKETKIVEQYLRVWVNRGADNLPEIFRFLEGANIRIQSVEVAHPSLDDVFLKYTGRSLRDSSGETNSSREVV